MPLIPVLPHNLNLAGEQHVGWFVAVPNTNAGQSVGIALTATGTATAYANASTSRFTMIPALEYLVTTASTTAVAGFRVNATWLARANIGGAGGFYFKCRWKTATGQTIATHRAFVGVRGSSAAPTDVNPSTLTNIVGMGWDAGDTNIQLMHNDGAGNATRIDLGANFPRPTADRANVYDIEIYAPRGGTTVLYRVVNVLSGAVAEGTLSTDLPVNTTLLAPLGYASVGGTSSVIGIGVVSMLTISGI